MLLRVQLVGLAGITGQGSFMCSNPKPLNGTFFLWAAIYSARSALLTWFSIAQCYRVPLASNLQKELIQPKVYGKYLLHQYIIVPLKGGLDIKFAFENPNTIFCLQTLTPTGFTTFLTKASECRPSLTSTNDMKPTGMEYANLQRSHVMPGQCSFESTWIDMNGFVCFWGPLYINHFHKVGCTAHCTSGQMKVQ